MTTTNFTSGEAVARAFFDLWNKGGADGIGAVGSYRASA